MIEGEKSFLKTYSFYLAIGIIVSISFFLFSIAFYPFVNSDDALNVLMAHEYQLPHDLYCWGQDRGGTLIPLISQVFKAIGFGSIYAVSLSNYLILFLGFWGWSTLFKDNRIILLLALCWFLPYQRFLNITSFPIGMGYSLIGFSLVFIQKINWKENLLTHFPNWFRLGAIVIIWLLAVWCSDLVFITLIVLFGTKFLHDLLKHKKLEFSTIVFAFVLVFIFLAIRKMKTYATAQTGEFMSMNSWAEIQLAFFKVRMEIVAVLSGSEDLLLALGAWILLVIMIFGMYLIYRNRKSFLLFESVWMNFLLFDALATLLVIFLAHWVLINEMGRWYFVAPYISISLLFLLLVEKFKLLSSKSIYSFSVILLLILGISSVTNVLHFNQGKYTSYRSTAEELNELGEIGIIGDYWDAYRLSIANPDQVKSTPHDQSDVKNQALVSAVFAQPKIYLSKDMWMEEFPDSIVQFGVLLKKIGKERKLGGSTLCQYKASKEPQIFPLDQLKCEAKLFQTESNRLELKTGDAKMRDKVIVFGPFISILPGKYEIRIVSNAQSSKIPTKSILFDVAADYGQKSLGFVDVAQLPFQFTKQNAFFTYAFETKELLQQAEFRILVKKPVDCTFYRYELIPLK